MRDTTLVSQAWYEWGPTTNYGAASSMFALPAVDTFYDVISVLSNLTPGQTCHFRLVATNSAGRANGADATFQQPVFTEVPIGLPLVADASLVWGDYNNDGRPDFLLMGRETNFNHISRIYRSNGDGTFADIKAGLPGLWDSSADWGDYDNDGWLDLLLTGRDVNNSPVSKIYRNNGSGTFTDINAGLPPVMYSATAWGDYNNDGRLDLLLTGAVWATNNSALLISRIYRNDGNGVFTDINAGLPGAGLGSVAWADYDNDGWLDFLLTGTVLITNNSAVLISRIYRNNGNGTFTDLNAGLPGVYYGSTAWSDYNNDGRPDLLLIGIKDRESTTPISRIYRNDGNGVFTDIDAGLPGAALGSTIWGDYNNDGRLDFVLTGITSDTNNTYICRIYRNDGNDSFTDLNAGLPGLMNGAGWVDYNYDGRSDLFLMGKTRAGYHFSGLYQNWTPITNTPPTAPAGLRATVSSGLVRLSWEPATDAQTPAHGLTYNLRVGTTPGGCDILSPQAGSDGVRRLSGMGNVQHGTNALLVAPGTSSRGLHYWSVQAVDSAGAGSPFAAEGTFLVPAKPDAVTLQATDVMTDRATLYGSVRPNSLPTIAWFEWGITPDAGNFTSIVTPGGGAEVIPVSCQLNGLEVATTYYYRLVAYNHLGVSIGEDQSFRTLDVPRTISGRNLGSSGTFQIQFAGAPGASYTVLVATNLVAPAVTWHPLGTAAEISPGGFQFTDTNSPSGPQRFYRLRWP